MTLNYHLENAPSALQKTAQHLKSSFYVDNCIASFDNTEEMERFVIESRILLSNAQFNLRDWVSNVSSRILDPTDMHCTNLLGLNWNIQDDTLSCLTRNFECPEPFTKRKILSIANCIFDPIGYICPVMLIPKLILQKSWSLKIAWDTEFPDDLAKECRRWIKTLPKLKDVKITRWVLRPETKSVQLHVFCDASQSAYATCIFLRVETENRVECSLIQARSRVAPLKKMSIPRLELLACLIGVRLAKAVIMDLQYAKAPITYWSDSTNALYWIKRKENWNVFVLNRVKEINTLSQPDDWRHIVGVENPADLPSRGCSADKLIQLRWWEGPLWLCKPESEWPVSNALPNIEIINAEKKKTIIAAVNVNFGSNEYFSRISSFRKIIRVAGWILRFVKNCKQPTARDQAELSVEEINNAENVIWRQVQRETLRGQTFKFQTYIQEDGLIRVRSRISMREDLDNFKYPILLPSKHPLVEKFIYQEHIENNHAGVQTMMSKLRENYWILKSRKTIKKILNKCTKCARFTATPIHVVEAPLPKDRVREAHIFQICGVDLCGPMILKDKGKCWAVLFTCAVYRAVHIELVTSLTTDSFILALRRFISRRGRPSTIYSDNGTNLVGTSNALQNVNWKSVQEFSTIKKIQWKFNPPSAPWWGGFWERLIGILKRTLRKIIGNSSLQHEELITMLCEAESLINSRPLTYVSEDPNDLKVLTPSMFLNEIEEMSTADLDEIDAKRLNKRHVYRLRLREDLRKRFRIEYFGQLRDHYKVRKESNVKLGDIVLVGDTNTKRISWPLARIIEMFPGKDNKVRVAKVKTASGIFLRPMQRLYPLELQDSERTDIRERTAQPVSPMSKTNEVRTRYGRCSRMPERLQL